MQPTYMPWAGYLNLMRQVDLFIYLDDAQYERSSWQNRNRVLVKGAPTWITVPVVRGHLGAKINEVVVDDQAQWQQKHTRLLLNAYARHENYVDLKDIITHLAQNKEKVLSDLNISLLDEWSRRLDITTPTLRSSKLGIEGTRTQRLISILNEVGATEYITPQGALAYLTEDEFCRQSAIKLLVHDFKPPPYPQRETSSFISHLSVLDVLSHIGWQNLKSYVHLPMDCFYQFQGTS